MSESIKYEPPNNDSEAFMNSINNEVKPKKKFYPQHYKEEWESIQEFSSWLSSSLSEHNVRNGFCKACVVVLQPRLATIKKHATSEKHLKSMRWFGDGGQDFSEDVLHPKANLLDYGDFGTPKKQQKYRGTNIPIEVLSEPNLKGSPGNSFSRSNMEYILADACGGIQTIAAAAKMQLQEKEHDPFGKEIGALLRQFKSPTNVAKAKIKVHQVIFEEYMKDQEESYEMNGLNKTQHGEAKEPENSYNVNIPHYQV